MLQLPTTPFLRSDALAVGLTPGSLQSALARNEIRRVFHGVYAPTSLTDTIDLRAACAALVLPPHCVVVERSAAWLHGVDLHAPEERFTVPDLEVVSLPGHTTIRRPGVYAGVRDLKDRDLVTLGGIRVTSPLRTALDLACLRGVLPALAALDSFMRRFQISREEFEQELPRFRRRRGVVQLRRLIPLATPLADSPGESWLRGRLIEDGFPPPEPQIEFRENGELIAKVDLGYRQLRIAIEYFGDEFHGPKQREHDATRIAWLNANGWLVIVVRKEDLREPGWTRVRTELANAIANRRRPRGKRRYPRGEQFQR
ncbi:type IV toxin-antitoxin system AbiEi family antitoxin [Nocardioides daejeonensis]|uniref:type IV toxin-antitoxin system AbiEi family antitoxin n=1 Tax=Nocardioides daejeonensis TaxID=1046556 RepID=UPI0013A53F17|nr:type IV toxin-antitoxin system AbiEi family antitoxin [Nocardioides daejeonensis]